MLSPYPIILDLIWVVLLLPHIPQIQLINFEKQKKGKEKTNLVQVWCTCFALDKAPNHTYMFFFPPMVRLLSMKSIDYNNSYSYDWLTIYNYKLYDFSCN